MLHFFMNTIIAVFQLKYLITKTPCIKIFKLWLTNFVSSKIDIRYCKIFTNSNLFNKLKFS